MNLENSVVVVTGASAGIGAATVRLLAQKGANVVITARRTNRLEALQQEVAALPGRRLVVAGNIQESAFALHLVKQTLAEFGRIDVLVNNAGLGHYSRLTELSPQDVRQILDTNVAGVLYAAQAAAAQMKVQRSGQIINISSIVSQRPMPSSAFYCASKTALNFISRGLRMELGPYGITVTTVYPGRTLTEFGDARLGDRKASPSAIGRVSAERAGRVIVRAMERRQSEVYITWYDWLFTHLNRLFPRSSDWVIAQVAEKFQRG